MDLTRAWLRNGPRPPDGANVEAAEAASHTILEPRAAPMKVRERYAPPGRLVEVDDRLVHVVERGDCGTPVVFESGMGGTVLDWTAVMALLPGDVRAFAYDRAGLGWSDPPRAPRSPSVIADEFAAVLQAAAAPGPYVLVAHSMGSRYARLFAQRHPDLVLGLVLVDGYHETWDAALGSAALASFVEARVRMWNGIGLLSRVGVTRLLGARMVALLGPDLKHLPRDQRARYAAVASRPGGLRTAADELRLGGDANDLLAAQSYGNLSLRVLTHGVPFPDHEQERAWQESQIEIASRSTRGTVIRAEGAGHQVMIARPDLVAAEIAAVLGRKVSP